MVNDIVLTSKGINAPYFKSGSSNISTTGILRLANNEGIGFRNAANSADLVLKVNATNGLEYNGTLLGTIAAALTASRALVSDGSGNVTVATTTTTELNYLAGVTAPTGSGALVLANSPTLITPTLGVASATSVNKITLTAPATGATLTLADGKTVTVSNTLTFTGTDSSSVAFGTGGTVAYTSNKLSAFAATTSAELAGVISDETGSGALVFATSPSLTTPSLGVATATSINGSTIPTSKTLVVTTDKLSALAATTSAELAGVISDETGSGALVFGTAPTLDKPVVNQIDVTQGASATAPASGKSAIYVNSGDAKLHVVDSSGNDVAVGSGSSGRNYLSDWYDSAKAESVGTSAATSTGNRTVAGNTDPTKWVTSDLTNLTFARSADTTLRQSYNYLINSGDANADFVESPLFTLDGRDLGKPISVSFDCAGVSASDDYQVCAVRYNSSGTYQEVITIAGTASATTPYSARIPVGTTSFNGFFIAGATATDQYAIRFMKHAVNVDLRIDSLYCGPQSVVQGAAVTDVSSTTGFYGTWTMGNTGSKTFTITDRLYRDGDRLKGSIACVGNSTASGSASGTSVTLILPSGLTIDTTKLAGSVNSNAANAGTYVSSSVLSSGQYDDSGGVYAASSTTLSFLTGERATTTLTIADLNAARAMDIVVTIDIPIVAWSSNVTMANRAVESYSSNSCTEGVVLGTSYTNTSYAVYGASGSLFPNITTTDTTNGATSYIVPFPDGIQPTDKLFLEVNLSDGYWVNADHYCPAWRATNTRYGASIGANNSTSVLVNFWRGGVSASSTYATAGGAWSGAYGAGYKWRVRKVSGGASVGYPIDASNIIVSHNTTATSNTILSGTYTSTLTNVANVASSTFRDARYIRIGNVVTVFVSFSIATTAAAPTITQFYMSLPIASALTTVYDCIGSGTRYRAGSAAMEPVYIETDAAGDRAYAYFTALSTTTADTSMSFSYVVK